MTDMATLNISTIDGRDNIRIASVVGQLDETNLPDFSHGLEVFISDPSVSFLLLDFVNLEFLNSKVIGYLADFHSRFVETGKRVFIYGAPDNVMDILELVGMTSLVPCFATKEEALDEIDA